MSATEITLADLPDGTIWNATGTPIRARAGDHEVTIPPAYGVIAYVFAPRTGQARIYGIPCQRSGVYYIVSRDVLDSAASEDVRRDLIAPGQVTDGAVTTFWSRHANPERK